jgi:DNA-binding NarL/FixJ family response regulator
MPIEAFMRSALLCVMDAVQSQSVITQGSSVGLRTTLRILFGPQFARVIAVTSALGYVVLLATGWALNAPVGFDGVLRPAPHAVELGPGFTVLEIEPGSPAERAGVRVGDIVVAVDGNPLVFDVHQTYHNRRAGAVGTLRVSDPGGPQLAVSFTLESRLASPSVVLGLLVASVLGLVLMAVGTGVAVIRPQQAAARLLLGFELGLALFASSDLWHWTQSTAAGADIVDRFALAAMLFGGAALVNLFLIFPARGRAYARVRRALPALYALSAISLGLSLVGVEELAGGVSLLALAGFLIGSLALLEQSYRRPTTPLARAQLGWIRWGLSVGVVATMASALAGLIVKDAMPASTATIVAAMWLLFPLSLAFAVLRYRLFEVDRVIRASITWGILAALLLVSYFILVITIGRLVASLLLPAAASDPTAAVVSALIVAALAHPIRTRLQAALDRHVYRDRFARARLLSEATEFLGEPSAPTAIARFLCQSVPPTLRLSGGWLAVPAGSATLLEAESGVLVPNVSLAGPALLEALRQADQPVLLARPEDMDAYATLLAVSADGPGVAAWYAAGVRLFVPLRSPGDGALLAAWALGAPGNGDLLDRDDLEALARVAKMAAMQLERAALSAPAAEQPDPQQMTAALSELLTAREREVMALLCLGYSNRQIADHLVIGVRTAETHVERILHKLNLENRAHAMLWARGLRQ